MISRPLSPHLQIYKLPFPAILSITHRLTGLFLVAALWGLIGGLGCLCFSADLYTKYLEILFSCPGKVVLWGALGCLYFHLLNGIRHLFWDAGYGFSLKATYISGICTVLGAICLTVFTVFY